MPNDARWLNSKARHCFDKYRQLNAPDSPPATLFMKNLRTIAVDLVPMLPGGDNGGAKIFVLELLRTLPTVAPEAKFILLTRKSSHHELAELVGENVSRQMVWDDEAKPSGAKLRIVGIGAAIARRIPVGFRRSMPVRLTQLWHRLTRRASSSSFISKVGADLLYCPFGGTVFADTSVPMAVTVYDLQYRSYPQFFSPEDYAVRDRNFRQACAMSAMAVISDYVRDSVIAQGLVDQSHVFTIHIRLPKRLHVVDETQQNQVLAKFDLQKGHFFIYPANFWPHKNHKTLIIAFEIALRSGLPHDTKLVLTGATSPHTREVLADAETLGVDHLVVTPGFIDKTELSALMMSSTAMIYPSLYEGFGMPVLEAMAMDCPVACSNITSLPEVAGDAALLFEPHNSIEIADSMVRLATDDRLRQDFIARGRRRVDNFADTGEMARQYWKLFELAFDGHVHIASASGIHADGWAGPQIILRYPLGELQRTMHIELQLPEWVPHSCVILEASDRDGRTVARHTLAQGTDQAFDFPIGSAATSTIISIHPYFRPAEIMSTSDTRDLSVMVRKVELCERNNTIVIFPPPA
jgi:glycosyltransferase involved in cell wall biosynthesis